MSKALGWSAFMAKNSQTSWNDLKTTCLQLQKCKQTGKETSKQNFIEDILKNPNSLKQIVIKDEYFKHLKQKSRIWWWNLHQTPRI